MKQHLQALKNLTNRTGATMALTAVGLYSAVANAQLRKVDLSQDASGGKDLNDTMNKAGTVLDNSTSLLLLGAALVGAIITMVSLYTIYKAGKDEREKPVSAVIGVFVGGAFLAVPIIMWLVRNSFFG